MTGLDLPGIDRSLDEFGIGAEKLAEVRARARELAQEAGGLDALLALDPDRASRAAAPVGAAPARRKPRKAAATPASPSAPVDTVVPEGAAARATTFAAETKAKRSEGASQLDQLPDALLVAAEIPPVLSLTTADAPASMPRAVSAPPPANLADPLELESEPGFDVAGAAPLDSLFQSIPRAEIPETRPLTKPPSQRPPADLDAELAALFAEESEPPPEPVPEAPEAPIVFDADAHMQGQELSDGEVMPERTMLVRPRDMIVPAALDEPAPAGDFELDFDDDVVVLDDAELVDETAEEEAAVAAAVAAAAAKSRPPERPKSRPPEPPKSRPPEPPRSRPPEAPGKGFLDRLLNRKG